MFLCSRKRKVVAWFLIVLVTSTLPSVQAARLKPTRLSRVSQHHAESQNGTFGGWWPWGASEESRCAGDKKALIQGLSDALQANREGILDRDTDYDAFDRAMTDLRSQGVSQIEFWDALMSDEYIFQTAQVAFCIRLGNGRYMQKELRCTTAVDLISGDVDESGMPIFVLDKFWYRTIFEFISYLASSNPRAFANNRQFDAAVDHHMSGQPEEVADALEFPMLVKGLSEWAVDDDNRRFLICVGKLTSVASPDLDGSYMKNSCSDYFDIDVADQLFRFWSEYLPSNLGRNLFLRARLEVFLGPDSELVQIDGQAVDTDVDQVLVFVIASLIRMRISLYDDFRPFQPWFGLNDPSATSMPVFYNPPPGPQPAPLQMMYLTPVSPAMNPWEVAAAPRHQVQYVAPQPVQTTGTAPASQVAPQNVGFASFSQARPQNVGIASVSQAAPQVVSQVAPQVVSRPPIGLIVVQGQSAAYKPNMQFRNVNPIFAPGGCAPQRAGTQPLQGASRQAGSLMQVVENMSSATSRNVSAGWDMLFKVTWQNTGSALDMGPPGSMGHFQVSGHDITLHQGLNGLDVGQLKASGGLSHMHHGLQANLPAMGPTDLNINGFTTHLQAQSGPTHLNLHSLHKINAKVLAKKLHVKWGSKGFAVAIEQIKAKLAAENAVAVGGMKMKVATKVSASATKVKIAGHGTALSVKATVVSAKILGISGFWWLALALIVGVVVIYFSWKVIKRIVLAIGGFLRMIGEKLMGHYGDEDDEEEEHQTFDVQLYKRDVRKLEKRGAPARVHA